MTAFVTERTIFTCAFCDRVSLLGMKRLVRLAAILYTGVCEAYCSD